MKRHAWLIRGVLGLVAWAGIGLGEAQAPVEISPVTSTGSLTAGPPTVSILDQFGNDITDKWLPEPVQTVTIRVNGLENPTIGLVCPDGTTAILPATCPVATSLAEANPVGKAAPTTSAYPGVCTNSGSNNDLSTDFTLTGSPGTGYQLTSHDCGGMAVIVVVDPLSLAQLHKFILPQNSDFPADAIPDIFEALYCLMGNVTCLSPTEDSDAGPGSLVGDGIAATDEYRGFMVSGIHIRTNPRQKVGTAEKQKDVFAHLVNPTGSTSTGSTLSLLGRAPGQTHTIYPTDGTSLFMNLNNLISGSQTHLLCYTPGATHGACNEWVDRFVSLTISGGTPVFTYSSDGGTTTTAPADDRQINRNAIYPLGAGGVQKGLRITESLDESTATGTPLGSCGLGPATGSDQCILYTKRIINKTNSLITAGGIRRLKYFTYENGAWTLKFTGAAAPTEADKNLIGSRHLQFILSMEGGHGVFLSKDFLTTYGFHFPENTGDNLDSRIVQVIESKTSGFNKFYIPSLYNLTDQSSFKIFGP